MERALGYGPLAAIEDRPRPGKEPVITPEAKAWLVSLACDKAKEHGYPHELWTTRLLARHAREHGPTVGHECLARLVQGTVCKILGQEEIKPHKVRYYLERRDAESRRWPRFCALIAISDQSQNAQGSGIPQAIDSTSPDGPGRARKTCLAAYCCRQNHPYLVRPLMRRFGGTRGADGSDRRLNHARDRSLLAAASTRLDSGRRRCRRRGSLQHAACRDRIRH